MSTFVTLVRKEFRSAFGGGDFISVMFFALAAVVSASFAFRYVRVSPEVLQRVVVGAMYLVFTFTGVVATRLIYRSEIESGGVSTLQLLGFSAGKIYLSKLVALWLMLFLLQCMTSIFLEQFLGISFSGVRIELMAINFLVSLGFAEVGVLLGLISLVEGLGERVLSLALLPFTLPLLYAAVLLTLNLQTSGQLNPADFWLHFLVALAVIYGAAGAILSDYFLLG